MNGLSASRLDANRNGAPFDDADPNGAPFDNADPNGAPVNDAYRPAPHDAAATPFPPQTDS